MDYSMQKNGESLHLRIHTKEVDIKTLYKPGVVAHAFNPSTWEAEASGFLSSRPAWSTK
jgi:major histocompatibility complex class I